MSWRLHYRDVSRFKSVKLKSQIKPDFSISFHRLSWDVFSSFPPEFPPIARNRHFRFSPSSVCAKPSETAILESAHANAPNGRLGEGAGLQLLDQLGGNAADHRAWRDVAGHDRARRHDRALADGHAG